MAAFDSVWAVIQHRTDSAYLFLASLLSLMTGFGHYLTGEQPPTLRAFTAVSTFFFDEQWSWIENTGDWVAHRSSALHTVGFWVMLGAALFAALQGSTSLKTKSGATFLVGWIIVTNTEGTSFWNWVALVACFLLGSLRHLSADWRGQSGAAVLGLVIAVPYSVIAAIDWLFGRTRPSTTQ